MQAGYQDVQHPEQRNRKLLSESVNVVIFRGRSNQTIFSGLPGFTSCERGERLIRSSDLACTEFDEKIIPRVLGA